MVIKPVKEYYCSMMYTFKLFSFLLPQLNVDIM